MIPLRVVEALILQSPLKEARDIYAYALAELVVLDVLRIQRTHKQPHANDPAIVRFDLVNKGENFADYAPTSFQASLYPTEFPRPISRLGSDYFSLKRDHIHPRKAVRKQLSELSLHGWNLGLFKTVKGRLWAFNLHQELRRVSRFFHHWLQHDPDLLRKKVARLGPLMLLAPNLSFSHLAKLAPLFERQTWPEATQEIGDLALYDWGNVQTSAPWEAFIELDTQVYRMEKAYVLAEEFKGTPTDLRNAGYY